MTENIDNPWIGSYGHESTNLRARLVSLVFSVTMSILYPISVHLWPGSSSLPRDHPIRIKRNFISIALVMLIASFAIVAFHRAGQPVGNSTLYDYLTWKEYPNLALWTWHCVILPILMVTILFLGPLTLELHDGVGFLNVRSMLCEVQIWRNCIVAPVTEEYLFRGILLSALLPSWSRFHAILISSLMFGLMHTHYFLFKVLTGVGPYDPGEASRVLFQCCYTTIFAFYNAYVYLASGHLISPILVHVFCNIVSFCLQFIPARVNLYCLVPPHRLVFPTWSKAIVVSGA